MIPAFIAGALAAVLQRYGMYTIVYSTYQHAAHPVIWVFSERTELQVFVYVATDDDNNWFYWWQTDELEKIAPVQEVGVAAGIIRGVIHNAPLQVSRVLPM